MKFSVLLFAVAALAATSQIAATTEAAESSVHVHIRVHKGAEDVIPGGPDDVHEHNRAARNAGAICYKQCPAGQHCARGTTTCRPPKTGTTECFNPATALWINKCDPGFKCLSGKCVYAKH